MAEQQLDILQGYVNDMLAVEKEIHQAFSHQKHDQKPQKFPAAGQLIARIEDTIDRHIEELEQCQQRLGADESALKKAVGAVMGAAAGLYDRIRQDDSVSRMLRDDYAALCFAIVCYEMLHTTALAMRNQTVADMALRHMRDFTPMVTDMSDVIPHVLVEELASEGKLPLDRSVAERAAENAREAWMQGSSLH
jgi:hypothetical protein